MCCCILNKFQKYFIFNTLPNGIFYSSGYGDRTDRQRETWSDETAHVSAAALCDGNELTPITRL